ncbi:MAG TPA: KH domain-containing protein [Acidobacteriaceae bacterium]
MIGDEENNRMEPGERRPGESVAGRQHLRATGDSTLLLISEIARALVDSPEEVVVEALERDESTVLRLHVSQADVGKVIGKQGRTAHSMRTILSAVSMKYHHRYTLDIVERDAEGQDAGAAKHGA